MEKIINIGDYVIPHGAGKLGKVIEKLSDIEFRVITSQKDTIGRVMNIKNITPLGPDDEIVEYPNNFNLQMYGICTTCLAHQNPIISIGHNHVECNSCRPGWLALFSTAMERDIHHLERTYGIKLGLISNKKWSRGMDLDNEE